MLSAIRIAVIDDHPLFRESVVETLTSAGSFEIVGEGATAGDALRLAEDLVPDVVRDPRIRPVADDVVERPELRVDVEDVPRFDDDVLEPQGADDGTGRGDLARG